MPQFTSLGLSPVLIRALTEEGYTTPTPIQAKAIPPALEGKDLLGCAQTGTGKTAAFALPILHRLMAMPADKSRRGPALPRVLVLSPTRELATQIGESFATYGRHSGLTHATIFGGVSQLHQVRALARGVDILVATPGRLEDLMQQGHVKLTDIRVFVLDEADRMLDMGFIEPIRRIAGKLTASRQTLLFSATMPAPIMRLADSLLRQPVKIAVTPVASAAPRIAQSVYMVPRRSKQSLLEHVIREDGIERALVFTRTKHGADRVSRSLNRAGITSTAIHGNKAQNQRQRALDGFRAGHARVLVATDVAARGLDVDGISHVFNFDIPVEPESYVHRIGRTGRAGATGIAISFCDGEERESLRQIEKLTGQRVPALTLPRSLPEPAPIEPPHRPEVHRAPRGQARPAPGRPGHSAPAPRPGHSAPAPRPGHSAPAPRPGHSAPAHASRAEHRSGQGRAHHGPVNRPAPAAKAPTRHAPEAHQASPSRPGAKPMLTPPGGGLFRRGKSGPRRAR